MFNYQGFLISFNVKVLDILLTTCPLLYRVKNLHSTLLKLHIGLKNTAINHLVKQKSDFTTHDSKEYKHEITQENEYMHSTALFESSMIRRPLNATIGVLKRINFMHFNTLIVAAIVVGNTQVFVVCIKLHHSY